MGHQQQPAAHDDQAIDEDLRTEHLRGLVHGDLLLAGLLHLPHPHSHVHETVQLQVGHHLRTGAGGLWRAALHTCRHDQGVLGLPVHLLHHSHGHVLPGDRGQSLRDRPGRPKHGFPQAEPGTIVQWTGGFHRRHVPEQAGIERRKLYPRDPSTRLSWRMGRLYPDGDRLHETPLPHPGLPAHRHRHRVRVLPPAQDQGG